MSAFRLTPSEGGTSAPKRPQPEEPRCFYVLVSEFSVVGTPSGRPFSSRAAAERAIPEMERLTGRTYVVRLICEGIR